MKDISIKLGDGSLKYKPMSILDGNGECDYLKLAVTNNTFQYMDVCFQAGWRNLDNCENDKAYGGLSPNYSVEPGATQAYSIRGEHWPFDDSKLHSELKSIEFWVRVDYCAYGGEQNSIRSHRVIVSHEDIGPTGDPDDSSGSFVPWDRSDLENMGWKDIGSGKWEFNIDGHFVKAKEEYLLARAKLYDGAINRLKKYGKTTKNLITTAEKFQNDIKNGKDIARLLRYYLQGVFAPTVEKITPPIPLVDLVSMITHDDFPKDVNGRKFLDPVHRNKVAFHLMNVNRETIKRIYPGSPEGNAVSVFLFKPEYIIPKNSLSQFTDEWLFEKKIIDSCSKKGKKIPANFPEVYGNNLLGIAQGPGNHTLYITDEKTVDYITSGSFIGSSEGLADNVVQGENGRYTGEIIGYRTPLKLIASGSMSVDHYDTKGKVPITAKEMDSKFTLAVDAVKQAKKIGTAAVILEPDKQFVVYEIDDVFDYKDVKDDDYTSKVVGLNIVNAFVSSDGTALLRRDSFLPGKDGISEYYYFSRYGVYINDESGNSKYPDWWKKEEYSEEDKKKLLDEIEPRYNGDTGPMIYAKWYLNNWVKIHKHPNLCNFAYTIPTQNEDAGIFFLKSYKKFDDEWKKIINNHRDANAAWHGPYTSNIADQVAQCYSIYKFFNGRLIHSTYNEELVGLVKGVYYHKCMRDYAYKFDKYENSVRYYCLRENDELSKVPEDEIKKRVDKIVKILNEIKNDKMIFMGGIEKDYQYYLKSEYALEIYKGEVERYKSKKSDLPPRMTTEVRNKHQKIVKIFSDKEIQEMDKRREKSTEIIDVYNMSANGEIWRMFYEVEEEIPNGHMLYMKKKLFIELETRLRGHAAGGKDPGLRETYDPTSEDVKIKKKKV